MEIAGVAVIIVLCVLAAVVACRIGRRSGERYVALVDMQKDVR